MRPNLSAASIAATHTGTFGRLGTLSFNGNKTITTGGGGAVLTNDSELARRAKHLTTTAKVPHRWEYRHDEIGYNYRLPNLNAALGCAQLEQLPTLLAAKRRLYERYRIAFAEVPDARLVGEPEGCRSNFWLQTLVLEPALERPARSSAGRDQRRRPDDASDLDSEPPSARIPGLPAHAAGRGRITRASDREHSQQRAARHGG